VRAHRAATWLAPRKFSASNANALYRTDDGAESAIDAPRVFEGVGDDCATLLPFPLPTKPAHY